MWFFLWGPSFRSWTRHYYERPVLGISRNAIPSCGTRTLRPSSASDQVMLSTSNWRCGVMSCWWLGSTTNWIGWQRVLGGGCATDPVARWRLQWRFLCVMDGRQTLHGSHDRSRRHRSCSGRTRISESSERPRVSTCVGEAESGKWPVWQAQIMQHMPNSRTQPVDRR